MRVIGLIGFFIISILQTSNSSAFTISISGDDGLVGERPQSSTCEMFGENAFTSDAGNTVYTDEKVYGGNQSLKLTIMEGSKGFGSLGGIIRFPNCESVGGRELRKGDEVWVRVHLFFPLNFEFNLNGRNKFIRLRTFDKFGQSEGYNDLYLDASVDHTTYDYIFEGLQQWNSMGEQKDLFPLGQWRTVEFYLKLDDKTQTEGGDARLRVWVDGKLIGNTGDRANLKTSESYIESLYFFTYWDNEGAHKTQSFYVDDLIITSDAPGSRDSNGFPFIGVGSFEHANPPQPPTTLSVQ
jgi:hypothetical protein